MNVAMLCLREREEKKMLVRIWCIGTRNDIIQPATAMLFGGKKGEKNKPRKEATMNSVPMF